MLDRPKIVMIAPHPDYTLDIDLSDHQNLTLDMKPFLSAPFYQKLSNQGFFLSVKHDYRTIYWDDMHDMHIDQILSFSQTRQPHQPSKN